MNLNEVLKNCISADKVNDFNEFTNSYGKMLEQVQRCHLRLIDEYKESNLPILMDPQKPTFIVSIVPFGSLLQNIDFDAMELSRKCAEIEIIFDDSKRRYDHKGVLIYHQDNEGDGSFARFSRGGEVEIASNYFIELTDRGIGFRLPFLKNELTRILSSVLKVLSQLSQNDSYFILLSMLNVKQVCTINTASQLIDKFSFKVNRFSLPVFLVNSSRENLCNVIEEITTSVPPHLKVLQK